MVTQKTKEAGCLPQSSFPGEGSSSLLALINAGLRDGITQAKYTCLPSLLVHLLSHLLFHCVDKAS